MSAPLRVLIVEDRRDDAELLVAELARAGFAPEWSRVDTREDLVEALAEHPSLILCDYSLPGLDALEVLALLREQDAEVPVIVVSGVMDEETCVSSLRMGAVDYLLKDRLTRLGPAVEHALTTRRLAVEARHARAAEEAATSTLRALVSHAPAAISVKAVDGRYELCNLQFERLCGVEPGHVVGRTDADLFAPERAREMTERDARCVHYGVVVEKEEEFLTPEGTRTMLVVRYPITGQQRDPGGRSGRAEEATAVVGVGAIYLDITAQKRTENELREVRERLQRRAQELGDSYQALREVDRMKTDFIASISHELRTPLTSIRGYVEMLRDGSIEAQSAMGGRFIEIIDRNSERLLNLIEDLLTLSRMDSGSFSLRDREVAVDHVVKSAAAVLMPMARQAGVDLSVRVTDDLPHIPGDPEQLERVLVNLLTNAVKFSASGATVVLTGEVREGGVRLVVRDEGIGISESDQAHLFTRFFRAAEARDRAIPGSGLGLTVVKGIVERHRGTIQIDSRPGKGTTVSVTLPALPAVRHD